MRLLGYTIFSSGLLAARKSSCNQLLFFPISKILHFQWRISSSFVDFSGFRLFLGWSFSVKITSNILLMLSIIQDPHFAYWMPSNSLFLICCRMLTSNYHAVFACDTILSKGFFYYFLCGLNSTSSFWRLLLLSSFKFLFLLLSNMFFG